MPLTAPSVEGPVSECSDRVRVEGQLPGAEVEVVAAGSIVGRTTASSASEVVSLTTRLSAGDEVAARQSKGGTTSSLTPDPVTVQAKPDPVGPVSFAAPVFRCAECLRVEGTVPGAGVDVEAGGSAIGRGEALHRGVHVRLRPNAPAGGRIEARQTACGDTGATVEAPLRPAAADGEMEGRLPAPEVHGPLQACRRVVPVSGVLPGARVVIHRSSGPDPSFCVGRPGRWNVRLWTPLRRGETIRASQELPACNLASGRSGQVPVGPPGPVDRPGIDGPLCAGGTTVRVTGLEAGAQVEIAVDVPSGGAGPSRRTVHRGAAPEEGAFAFRVDPLPPRADVTARQTICGIDSAWSAQVTVHEAPEELDVPRIPGPLFECATVVRVTGLTPGTWVYVESRRLGAPIGWAWADGTERDVRVAPQLAEGDEIVARAVGCGEESDRSRPETVRPLEELGPPTVEEPVWDCPRPVRVSDVVPGAAVDVYVDGVWAGTGEAGATTAQVDVPAGRLREGAPVTARQRLCGRVSDPSRPVPVRHFEGEWTVVEEDAGVLAIHAALLPTGEVLYFGGDQHHRDAHDAGNVDHTRLWDPETGEITAVSGLTTDVFCAGHALLEDGSLLTGGGTADWTGPQPKFFGSNDSWRFDPSSGAWSQVGDLVRARSGDVEPDGDPARSGGRWYPALVTLADGRVLALGGEPDVDDRRDVNDTLELYESSSGGWTRVGSTGYGQIPGASDNPSSGRRRQGESEYMRLHVLPDRSVLSVSEMEDGEVKKWNPYTDPTAWDTVRGSGLPADYDTYPQRYTSALLPLRPGDNWTPRVLLAGMTDAHVLNARTGAVDTPSRDLAGSPVRHYAVATLLPTGEVVVTGGVGTSHDDADAVPEVEIFDPGTDSWRTGPAAQVPRNYHSVALLLPDGSVWTAGSNHDANSGGEAAREFRMERYEPWYFCESRPTLGGVEDRACHGDTLRVRTPDARAVDRVVVVRCGSVTHAWNFDQRHVTLPHDVTGVDELEASVPSNPALAVPGPYLLFVLDADGVPSEGRFVEICTAPGTDGAWWRGVIDWEALREALRRARLGPDLPDLDLATSLGIAGGDAAGAAGGAEPGSRETSRTTPRRSRMDVDDPRQQGP